MNTALQEENSQLKEKLLDLEYRQRRNNLIFDGITEGSGETGEKCAELIRSVLSNIPNLKQDEVVLERCHRKGPKPKSDKVIRSIICCFNSYVDIAKILENKSKLPRGVYVSEDLPDEWLDCRKVLKPIYNAAKRMEKFKQSTFLSRDKLIINGKAYTTEDVGSLESLIDMPNTCQRADTEKIVFQGCHSVYSNLHLVNFSIENIEYTSVEQFLQAGKAALFDDDHSHYKIMNCKNPYKIKKLGSRIRNYEPERWKKTMRGLCYKAMKAKFQQNSTLRGLLLNTGHKKIVESTAEPVWGNGMRLFDKNAMDETFWKQDGLMCELYMKLRSELKKKK